ncbi:hypothetical protein ASG92_01405 [Arthrobacter sp. Soil736]|nr:hypothetical protein ASG92_01405 [Arthrobacter sp. Soil736]
MFAPQIWDVLFGSSIGFAGVIGGRRTRDAAGPGLAQALIVRELCETRSNIDRSGLVTDVHVQTRAERRAPLCSSLILRPLESMPVSVL